MDDAQKILAISHIERYNSLKSMRGVLETHLQDVADYTLPRKNNITKTTTPGEKKINPLLFDSTAPHAAELLASALHGILTNPASLFFEMVTGNEELDSDDEVRLWLQKLTLKMHHILNNSNFQTEIHETYIDLIVFGTAPFFIEEDDDKVVRFSARSIAEAVVDENNKGVIDTIYRLFKWSAKNIIQEFGKEAVSEQVLKAYEKNSPQTFDIIHGVFPRLEDQKATKEGPLSYNFGSIYILKDEKFVLKESGFREFPCPVPRWSKITGEVYGRSPAMTVLPDVKMINAMMKTTIEGAQKQVSPPMMVPDDGFIMPLKTTPNGVNYYRSGTTDKIMPLVTGARIDFAFQILDDVRKRINAGFYIDQLQLNNGPQMTATEVMQRRQEQMRLMGPVLGRQHNELLRPMIDRLTGVMIRKNLLPQPIPSKLSGAKLDVQYSSEIAKAQRASEGDNIGRVVQGIAPFIQTDQTAMDNIDSDAAVRFVSRIYGAPQEIMRTVDEVKQIRKDRAQAQQKASQQQEQMHAAEVASKALPAAAKAKDAGVM